MTILKNLSHCFSEEKKDSKSTDSHKKKMTTHETNHITMIAR
jgi:hypothetical protein